MDLVFRFSTWWRIRRQRRPTRASATALEATLRHCVESTGDLVALALRSRTRALDEIAAQIAVNGARAARLLVDIYGVSAESGHRTVAPRSEREAGGHLGKGEAMSARRAVQESA